MSKEVSGSLLLAWQVKGKHCLVIGSGDVALSRINHLIRANAKITVITGGGHIHEDIVKLHEEGVIYNLVKRNYQSRDLKMYEKTSIELDGIEELINPSHYEEIRQVVEHEVFANVCCCIDDYELSERIYYQCKFLRLPVNIADKPPLCDFYFGSMFNQDNLQIMISTNGKSPRLSKLIKDNIARQFEGIDLNKAVENLGLIRSCLRSNIVIDDDLISIDTRMNWIKQLTDYFSLKEWSYFNLTDENCRKIISYFPEFPPKDYQEFEKIISN